VCDDAPANMERPIAGTCGGANDVAPSYASATRETRRPSPATFFAPYVSRGWRFVRNLNAGSAPTYDSARMVTPGNDGSDGNNVWFFEPGLEWFTGDGKGLDEDCTRVLRACGLLVAKSDAAYRELPKTGRKLPPRLSLRDHIAKHLQSMVSSLVAFRVSATVYRHRRWAFECFRESFRNSRELKQRLRNSKKSALGREAMQSLKTVLDAFDVMFEILCDPHRPIRAEFYDGVALQRGDADYEWQKNAAFDDELFNVPYAERNTTDSVRDVNVERVQKQCSESEGSDRSTLTDVAQRKRSASEEIAMQRSGKVCRIARSQISCRIALDIAAEVDIVMGIVCHFFATCDMCKDGPSFHEYCALVTCTYDYSFANEMVLSLENTVLPEVRDNGFPDQVMWYYTLLLEKYRSTCDAKSLLKLIKDDPNPMLHISLMQKIEGVLIMSADDPSNDLDANFNALMSDYASAVAVTHHKKIDYDTTKNVDVSLYTPCPETIRRWRDACRLGTLLLYSQATPSFSAIKELIVASPPGGWLEIGSQQTGYWAELLRKCGVAADALNVAPASTDGKVAILTPRSAACAKTVEVVPDLSVEYADKGIIISCCPKDGKLANDAVRKFRGDTIAVVGEWQGITAGSSFLRRLAKRFNFVKSMPLPQLSDRSLELSIWKRREQRLSKKKRSASNMSPADVFPPVQRCRVAGCEHTSHTMFCCRLCRSAFVCDRHLHALHDEWDIAHSVEHSARLLPKLNMLRSYEIELGAANGSKMMRSETIMAFNPYKRKAECWTVDYCVAVGKYDNVQLRLPRIDEVKDWR